MKNIFLCISKAMLAALIIILCLALFLNLSTLTSLDKIKRGGVVQNGFAGAIVSSGSMAPAIRVNDLVVIKGMSSYQAGDIITFVTGRGSLLTHRVIKTLENGYITQGDANNAPDDEVSPQRIMGRVVFIFPGAGFVIKALTSPLGILLLLAVPACVFLANLIQNRNRGA